MNPADLLKTVNTILVIDWPSKDVPESLALAGFHVIVQGGPGPEDYFTYEAIDGKVTSRRTGRIPDRAELVYTHRPLADLAKIIATATALDAKAIWSQSGLSPAGTKDPKGCWVSDEDLQKARDLIQPTGLQYISEPYIGDVARQLQGVH